MIKPYLWDLINNHKPTIESNNEENNEENDSAEWKIQLVIQSNFISGKNFEDTWNIYSASKPVGIFMDSDTENAIDTLFNTILERIQKVTKHQMKEEADLLMKMLLYCIIIFRK